MTPQREPGCRGAEGGQKNYELSLTELGSELRLRSLAGSAEVFLAMMQLAGGHLLTVATGIGASLACSWHASKVDTASAASEPNDSKLTQISHPCWAEKEQSWCVHILLVAIGLKSHFNTLLLVSIKCLHAIF